MVYHNFGFYDMATIRQRSGNWQAIIVRKGYPSQSATFDTKSEAKAWATDIEAQMKRGLFVSLSKAEQTTLKELLERYRDEVAIHHKGYSEDKYRLDQLARHKTSLRYAATLRSVDFATYRDERLKTVSPGTVCRELSLLHAVFELARKEWDINIPNPISDVRRPKVPPGRDRRLTEKEENELLDKCKKTGNPWLHPVIVIALETAMRRGEILSIRWENVDLKKRTVQLADTKNGTSRTVPLSPQAINTLKSLPRSLDGQVFPTSANAIRQT